MGCCSSTDASSEDVAIKNKPSDKNQPEYKAHIIELSDYDYEYTYTDSEGEP